MRSTISDRYGREWFIEWSASLLCGLFVAIGVGLLGGPVWAAFGFGILTFYVFRVGDRIKAQL